MVSGRYNIGNLKQAICNPSLFINELHRIYNNRIYNRFHIIVDKKIFDHKYGKGINVMEKDWDNLIILDACRYDVFKEINEIDGKLDQVVSRGSHSEDFIEANFVGKNYHDTIYISGNPFIEKIPDGTFHKIIKSYDKGYPEGDPIYESRHPGRIYNIVNEAVKEYPNKRIIVHFMQPHTPYLGPQAENLREQLKDSVGLRFRNWEYNDINEDTDEPIVSELLDAASEGYISQTELEEVYIENLRFVFDYVEDLLQELRGKTVITSDHGEMFGDPTGIFPPEKFQHERNMYCPELRIVPWLVIDSEERPEIIPEKPKKMPNIDEGTIKEQLQALGYTSDAIQT